MHQNDDERTRFERGKEAIEEIYPGATRYLLDTTGRTCPDLVRFTVSFAYGDVYSRGTLPPRTRQFLTVAALASLGNAETQLKFHLEAALNVGCSPAEILETLCATATFSGFPAAINAVRVAREVFDARGVQGGAESDVYPEGSRRERGIAALSAINGPAGETALRTLAETAPALADFILDFCYGDVFARRVLDHATRSLVLVAAGAARGTMWHQVKVHARAALLNGVTQDEILEAMIHLAIYAGFPVALNGVAAVRDVFRKMAEEGSNPPSA